ncbi:MAG TPA: hypothetical protein VFI87_10115 [Hyphomicrobiaceae bacterium]|nr:hypothetical protein [Hyphomicrobiaceae bacterium]
MYGLLASVVVNLALGWAYLGERDRTAVATTERDQARGDATACSDATDALREAADKRAADGKTRQAAARQASVGRTSTAQQILATPAAVPGDDYASARARVDGWLQTRAKP